MKQNVQLVRAQRMAENPTDKKGKKVELIDEGSLRTVSQEGTPYCKQHKRREYE
jgi:hypothetical protein